MTRLKTLGNGLFLTLLVVAAGLFHGANWTFSGWWPGAWIGQCLLTIIVVLASPRTSFLAGLAVGCIGIGWAFNWAPDALQLTMDASWLGSRGLYAALVFWESFVFGIFAGLTSRFAQSGVRGLLIAPIAWVVAESWWPRIFPWLLGYSQLDVPVLIQIAELTGSGGISFVVAALATLPAVWILWSKTGDRGSEWKPACWITAGLTCLLLVVVGFGVIRQSQWEQRIAQAEGLRLGMVQADPALVGSEAKMRALTLPMLGKVDLICWPESSIGNYSCDLDDFTDREKTLQCSRDSRESVRPAAGLGCDLLAGGRTYRPGDPEEGPYAMTAFLINPSEQIVGRYVKRTLLPFGEYMPGQDIFPQLREWATLRELVEVGTDVRPLRTSRGERLGVVICYEDMLRQNVRATVAAGAEILFSLINDSAFENPLTLEQHKRLAQMRAVEHRRFFARCAGTGVTCVISPTGKILQQLEINAEGSLICPIKCLQQQTLYTQWGDYFPWSCTLILAISLIGGRRRRSQDVDQSGSTSPARHSVLVTVFLAFAVAANGGGIAGAEAPVLSVDTPMQPPAWALLERELLRQNAAACREFFEKYFDDRGWLLCVERWGGDDGPDDAIENCLDWPVLHALGGSDDVLDMYKKAWEGHLRQYTLAKTTEVPFARDGMYYKEFPVMMDWLHNGEGLVVFNLQGLSDPKDGQFARRVRRFAGFYMNEDPGAPNYDEEHKLIRSMFNGSRGPLLRKATALDWAGDPIEVENRFRPKHGESSYAQMLEHFRDYNDIVGDHPQNLKATTLALNAYLLTHENKYRQWLLEYVDAWRDRMIANNNIIPTNIGLDGKIGGEAGGKWWGGVYGWGFTVFDPATKRSIHRNQQHAGFQGFMNAFLLTGDDRYLDPWRKQIDGVNANQKVVEGKTVYPHMHGAEGWYDYTPEKFSANAFELAFLSMKAVDLARVSDSSWLQYLSGKNPTFPEIALRADLRRVGDRVHKMRDDPTTPDTRLADDPMEFNPASVESLLQLMLGGLHPGRSGSALFSRLRYFDPEARRAGIPEDVAALIEELTEDRVTVTLVNVSQLAARRVVIQAGAYAEHRFDSVEQDGTSHSLMSPRVTVTLAPGSGTRFTFIQKRFVNRPTLAFPWDS